MRGSWWALVGAGLLCLGGVAGAQGKSGAPRSHVITDLPKQAGPVDARLGDRTRGPGAADIQPEHDVVPAVGGPAHGKAATDRGHVPTDQELAQGAAPAIVELPPVPRTLEYAEEGVRPTHHGAGHE